MCASFEIKENITDLSHLLEAELSEEFVWKPRIFPKYAAPVLLLKNNKKIIEPRNFGLIPTWMSDEDAKKIKWNYNAREDKIEYSKWWKDPLSKKRCLIPISRFFESIDEGEYAGYMVAFKPKESSVLLAAGMYDDWTSSDGKILRTFTIITGEPTDFVRKVGHDRNPLFPHQDIYNEWLSEVPQNPKDIKDLLLKNLINDQIDFEVEKDRKKVSKLK